MAACCGRSNVKEEDYKRVGLEKLHAYSLLDVQQVGSQRYTVIILISKPLFVVPIM